jgi:glycosyltransferase involved in cell wall biosynthesis
MSNIHTTVPDPSPSAAACGIELEDRREHGVTILRRAGTGGAGPRPRRVLFVMGYGMAAAWRLYKRGLYPGQHLFGCLELARAGYEVLLPEPADPRGRLREHLSCDRLAIGLAAKHLQRDDVLLCGHNKLLATPLLRRFGYIRCRVIGYLHGPGRLPFAHSYDGVLCMTPAASRQALANRAGLAQRYLPWGVDLPFYPELPYFPRTALSCGKTHRDLQVIVEAFSRLHHPCDIICPEFPEELSVPANVRVVSGAQADHNVPYAVLLREYYARAAMGLVTLAELPDSPNPYGITSALESMAMGRPVILTRTGCVAEELDVEARGVGLYVRAGDNEDLARAVRWIFEHPEEAGEMGRRGRMLCRDHYNMERFGRDLVAFLSAL